MLTPQFIHYDWARTGVPWWISLSYKMSSTIWDIVLIIKLHNYIY